MQWVRNGAVPMLPPDVPVDGPRSLQEIGKLTSGSPDCHPDLRSASVVKLVFRLLLAPAWLLLRMLRLRYRQPWTQPDQWEPGDEFSPRRGLSPRRPAPRQHP